MFFCLRQWMGLAAMVGLAPVATSQASWTDWISADAPGLGQETAIGQLDGGTVTFVGNLNPAAQVAGPSSYWISDSDTYTSALVSDPPPIGDILRMTGGPNSGVYMA